MKINLLPNFTTEVPNPRIVSHLKPLRPYFGSTSPTFKIFSPSFYVDWEEVHLQLQMELIDLSCSEDLKSTFSC